MDKPPAYTVNNNQRSLLGLSGKLYHLTVDQSVSVVKKVDIAYTSPSTAENQIEVQKAVVKPATKPAPAVAQLCPWSISPSRPTKDNFVRSIQVQAIKAAAKAVQVLDIKLTAKAILAGSAEKKLPTQANRRPTKRNNGAPGGWTTCSL